MLIRLLLTLRLGRNLLSGSRKEFVDRSTLWDSSLGSLLPCWLSTRLGSLYPWRPLIFLRMGPSCVQARRGTWNPWQTLHLLLPLCLRKLLCIIVCLFLFLFVLGFFETGSQNILQAGFPLGTKPRVGSNFRSSCLSLLSVRIIGVRHHTPTAFSLSTLWMDVYEFLPHSKTCFPMKISGTKTNLSYTEVKNSLQEPKETNSPYHCNN